MNPAVIPPTVRGADQLKHGPAGGKTLNYQDQRTAGLIERESRAYEEAKDKLN